jgi:hypothetical protein
LELKFEGKDQGDNHFVLETLKQSEEYLERKYSVRLRGYYLEKNADRVAAVLNIESEQGSGGNATLGLCSIPDIDNKDFAEALQGRIELSKG